LRDSRSVEVTTLADAADAAQEGFARLPWSLVGDEGENRLATSGVSVRCLQRPDGGLAQSAAEPDLIAYVARAYSAPRRLRSGGGERNQSPGRRYTCRLVRIRALFDRKRGQLPTLLFAA